MNAILEKLQKLGKALMLPIAALPIAGILLRLGQDDVLNIKIIADAGDAIFTNLPLLFAIGIAVGLAKNNDGAAGLAGAISYFVLSNVSQAVNYARQTGSLTVIKDEVMDKLDAIDIAHLGGIVAGVIAGLCYNKFHKAKLPDWLQFFGGRRFVPIITSGISLFVGILFGFIWPALQGGLDTAGTWMYNNAGIGALVYGLLNRLLLPFGLHHVVNTVVWTTFGDLVNFAPSKGVDGGVFTAGFFPIMMFALPAAALAMYVCAHKDKKAIVGGALFSVAFTSFLCGITEPIEFMFMFLAPVLFVIHSILMGVSLFVCQMFEIRDSFSFSAGAIDYVLNFGIATKPLYLILIGLIFAVIYFFLFVFFIKKFDLKTPGREDDEETSTFSELEADRGMSALAADYVKLIGGKENVKDIEACITRIRLVLKDNSDVDEAALKTVGASGVMKAGKQTTQIIVGTKAELLVDEMKKLLQ